MATDRVAGAGLLASNDVRYHAPERRRLADLRTAMRLGIRVDALGYAAEPIAECCLKAPAEMARLLQSHPGALASTLRVLKATSGFSLNHFRHEYLDEILKPGRTVQETLAARMGAVADERWPDGALEDMGRLCGTVCDGP